MKNYRSCFIVDVKIDKDIVLTDSQRNRYFVDAGMDRSEFQAWFKKFISGVSQTLTVFEYETRGEGCDFELHIVKFFNTAPAQING